MSTFRKYQYWKKKHPDALGEIYAVWNTKELNPEGDPKVYFGQGKKAKMRFQRYKSVSNHTSVYGASARLKTALQNFQWKYWKKKVIIRAPAKHLDILETSYIWKFKAQSPDYGYNTQKGGRHSFRGVKRIGFNQNGRRNPNWNKQASPALRQTFSLTRTGKVKKNNDGQTPTHLKATRDKEGRITSFRVCIFKYQSKCINTWKEAVALRNAKYAELGLDHLVNDTPNPYE